MRQEEKVTPLSKSELNDPLNFSSSNKKNNSCILKAEGFWLYFFFLSLFYEKNYW